MRIAMLSPPWIPVPPSGYGGIEWVVSLLTEELVARGHDVTLFATGDSHTKADLRAVFDVGPVEQMHQAMPYAMHVGAAYQYIADEARAGRPFDVLHDHTAWLALSFAGLLDLPVVHTLHGAAVPSEETFFRGVRDRATFVAISRYQTESFTRVQIDDVVPNAMDISSYAFRAEKDGYLLCLGRIARDKAQADAIEIARRAGYPIMIAGKVDPGGDAAYFEEAILPHVDGENVRFLGEVSDERKRELFAGAKAFLFPIRWAEPFGLVMVEALASGTPVIATPSGAVPEVIEDGLTGFLAPDIDGMVAAVGRLDEIDPARCRAEAERRFSPSVMADGYLAVYERIARGR